MAALKRFLARLSNLFHSGRAERELAREVAAHLALIDDDFRRRGLSPDEAQRAARQALGGVDQTKELHRDARSLAWLEDLRRDLGYAVRSLARSPGFAAVAILTLTLGIGANTAIFSVVNSVLLRPLPFADSDRLAGLFYHQPASESPTGVPRRLRVGLSVADLIELRRRTDAITHAGASGLSFMVMTGGNETTRLEGARVSPALLQMLGVRPALGRIFTPADESLGAEPVVILSHAAWRRYFAGDPAALGRTVALDDVFARIPPASARAPVSDGPTRHTIVGVMPEDFRFGRQDQFWIPLSLTETGNRPPPRGELIARLADGVTPDAAAAEVGAIVRDLHGQKPAATAGGRYEFVRLQDLVVAPVRPALLVLMTAVGLVLLIACVNVANLLFARTSAREREIAVRVALGASRGRVIRQLLTETVLLTFVGAIAGVSLAVGGVRLLRTLATTIPRLDLGVQLPFPRLEDIAIDTAALAFAITAAFVTAGLCGLGPALRHSRVDQGVTLRTRSVRNRTRGVLVIAEVAMATALLVGGGLLIRSFTNLATVRLGYDPSNVLTFQVGLPPDRYSSVQLRTFAETVVARLRAAPGVQEAAYARQLPLVAIAENAWFRRTPNLPDRLPPNNPEGSPDARLVSTDYLDVMGIRVVSGRAFDQNDDAGRPRVLLVNEALARRDFPGEDPVGRFVYVGRDSEPWQIVGVVSDVRQFGQDQEPRPQIFADFRQWPDSDRVLFTFLGPYYAVRVEGDPAPVVAHARTIARGLDTEAGLFNVATMEQLVANRISRPRMYAVLLGLFAGIAAALAAIGIYGVIAYAVAQRTHEIGVRMALGARARDVIRLAVGESLIRTAIGIAIGLAAAGWLTRFLEGMLFGLTPLDPPTFAAVAGAFAVLAALASFMPARRAVKVDPLIALRCD
jgi:putative ABC transport system permease protein